MKVSPTKPAVRVKDGLVARLVGDETVILDLESGEFYSLNGVGSFIWERINEGAGLNEIVDSMVEHYEVEHDDARADLAEFAAELTAMGLIET
jgi:hypothetical protein